MPRVHRSLHLGVFSRGASSPNMPVLSPLNAAVGALCYTFTDSQPRALSFSRIKAIHGYHLDVPARNSGRVVSCYDVNTVYSVQASCCRNRPHSQISAAQWRNTGRDVVKSGGLSLDGGARQEHCSVPLTEAIFGERRPVSRYLLKASVRSLDVSSGNFLSSRAFKGFSAPLEFSTLQRLSSLSVREVHVISSSSHTGYLTSNSVNEGSQNVEADTVQSDNSLLKEGKPNISKVAMCNGTVGETWTRAEEDGDSTSDSEASIEEVSSDRVRNSVERRRRSTSNSSRPGPEWRDLLTVPGIGRRNMEKLVAKGIAKLDELKQLYRDKYQSDGAEKMVEFLRSSVGVHKHHATSIADFIKNSVEAEDGRTESGLRSKKRLTFCVEGNISVGKTTFLHRIANETIELRDLVEIVPEPISKWQDVGPDHFNILDAFYGDPERYAYTFQNYVFVTRMMQERESAHGEKKLRLMERSVFSDRMVFVRAVHEAKWMSDAEISIYDSWFDPVVSAMPGLVPDAFIYLRATPDTCHRRLQSRKRKEEDTVTLDYLRDLHEKHEQWLFPAERRGSNVLSVTDWASGHRLPLSPRLRDRVLYLKGENVHSSIQKVPALILDCEPSIDFSKDVEAKAEYARQVAEFFEYVQALKDGQTDPENGPGALVLPGSSGLLGPDGSILTSTSLDGVDFRRQMSVVCS